MQEQILFHAVLIALLIADWRKALLIYFLPCGLAKDMLVSLNILQHDGCDAKSKYNHSRNFTSDALTCHTGARVGSFSQRLQGE